MVVEVVAELEAGDVTCAPHETLKTDRQSAYFSLILVPQLGVERAQSDEAP